jgi:hypothetical protein
MAIPHIWFFIKEMLLDGITKQFLVRSCDDSVFH